MYLNLINQIGKLLNSDGDLMRSMNMVLIMLQEYLPIRNPCLLIRDNVINKYFIDLGPEISEVEKNQWNQRTAKLPSLPALKLQHEMILYPDEPDHLQLPCPSLGEGQAFATIIQPVTYQQQHLPLCIFSVIVTELAVVNDVGRIIKFIADMLAVSMIARGFPVIEIQDSFQQQKQIPKIIDNIVGQSEKLKQIADIIKRISASKTNVLIYGESGTGKELIASAIHNNSLHRKAPFISVNCAALSENLLESELFGHEKGAFTGASNTRKGRFELADGGTLFLDEIGDTSLGFQAKILRVIQEGQFERLGGSKTINVDVRVVCATNVLLEQAVENGTFREDLYYRLNVIRLEIPPLRERREDIGLLIDYFIDKFNEQTRKNVRIRPKDKEFLSELDWPGNVRELENTIHSAFLMEQNNYLNFSGKFKELSRKRAVTKKPIRSESVSTPVVKDQIQLEELEAIEDALKSAKGIQIKAAEMLGISLRQLRYRIRKYNIIVRKINING
ncbi:sigma 54-interacting transcriptional regulator [bacterium]|nr:sigma 54-interacting transcriptional regulator [bacterium]